MFLSVLCYIIIFCVPIGDCPPGQFIDGDNCTDCPVGKYQDMPRKTDCILCPSGKNTSGGGHDEESDCTSMLMAFSQFHITWLFKFLLENHLFICLYA